ncbi:MAG: hypothetical protein M1827_003150 [Pycnora praestabilis]|nr:MAG: hypothetical protein M1827_003150 [Pycnora praestabilis]
MNCTKSALSEEKQASDQTLNFHQLTTSTTFIGELAVENIDTPVDVSHEGFPFLKLSGQLRTKIYKLTLCSKGIITSFSPGVYLDFNTSTSALDLAHNRNKRSSEKKDKFLALLSTCHEIYKEAMPIFYAHNTFRFNSTAALYDFLNAIGPDCRRHLGHIEVCCWGTEATDAYQLLAEANHLRSIVLTFDELELITRKDERDYVASIFCCDVLMMYHLHYKGWKDLNKTRGLKALRELRGLEHVVCKERYSEKALHDKAFVEGLTRVLTSAKDGSQGKKKNVKPKAKAKPKARGGEKGKGMAKKGKK